MKPFILVAALVFGIVPAAVLALPCLEENTKFSPERQAQIAELVATR